ncbi:MAG: hypothetical protein HY584_01755 [Candidatus Omnitrophica bacterium]|nr:hypothetical protein [Candidatus Omnitrophota bacterium]
MIPSPHFLPPYGAAFLPEIIPPLVLGLKGRLSKKGPPSAEKTRGGIKERFALIISALLNEVMG